jgi:NAD(P)-dependent dehydrogenase (short-subunit alcohol dehydrogenase family)
MNAFLTGKGAIVSGGARGIGLAITQALAGCGAHVVVIDNGAGIDGGSADAREVRQAVAAIDGAELIEASVAEAGVPEQAVQRAIAGSGGIDIVVNNAAILRDSFIFKGNRDNWNQVIESNLSGAYALLAAATPAMRDGVKAGRAPGRILNIISSAGLIGNFGQSAYASSKGGLTALTRIVAMDLARNGITANAIAPFAATRVTESIVPANDEQRTYKERALRIPAAYVANLVLWLASPAAAKVTGQLFGVRGREVFLFSQPRPVARIVAAAGALDIDAISAQVESEFEPLFTDLKTDLELFNSEPIL